MAFNQHLSFELLKEAGYDYTNRGWYQHEVPHQQAGASKAGQLAFRILTVKDFQDVAQVISDDLSQIGVPTEVQVLEYTTLRSKYLKSGDFDVFLWSRSAGTDPDCSLVWGTGGPLNFVNYSDPSVDRLIQEGRKNNKSAEENCPYGSIQQILAEQLPWVFLVQPKLLIAHKPDINNVRQPIKKRQACPGTTHYSTPPGGSVETRVRTPEGSSYLVDVVVVVVTVMPWMLAPGQIGVLPRCSRYQRKASAIL